MKGKYLEIKDLIQSQTDVVDFGEFGSGVTEYCINKAEKRLRVKFPPSYVWWLKNYGGGEIHGEEVFSIYEMDFDRVVGGDIVYINELNRKNGLFLENELVIQENNEGESYFMDLSKTNEDGEAPIYIDITRSLYASDFLDFLRKKIEE